MAELLKKKGQKNFFFNVIHCCYGPKKNNKEYIFFFIYLHKLDKLRKVTYRFKFSFDIRYLDISKNINTKIVRSNRCEQFFFILFLNTPNKI